MKYTISKQDNQLMLIEKDAEHIPVCLDIHPSSTEKAEQMLNQEIGSDGFEEVELEIPGYPGTFYMLAKLK